MWAFPIPAYDGQSASHKQLAYLGNECKKLAESFIASLPTNVRQGSLGRLRSVVREKLQAQIAEIDKLLSKVL
jgi:hypothetical protein